MIAATKNLPQMSVAGYVTLGNLSCNLCRNKIARQVAREIAYCDSALNVKMFSFHCIVIKIVHENLTF